MKFLCEQCKAKYQIADEKVAGKTVRMKCRKCGHMIEVKAEVTETSVNSALPRGEDDDKTKVGVDVASLLGTMAAPRPSPPGKPSTLPGRQAPRPGGLATSLAAAKPPPRAERNESALAGAFQRSVQRHEELAPLETSNEWYVAINGVPVGPVRLGELRRKAAAAAVTEESLVWQEGMEEWRPLKTVPDLLTLVREAAASERPSLVTSQPPGAYGPRPSQPSRPAMSTRPDALRSSPAPAAVAAARSNVVSIASRLATAEKLEPEPAPSIAPDPFATPPPPDAPPAASPFAPAAAAAGVSSPLASPFPSSPPVLEAAATKKGPNWMAVAMVVLAAAFGVTAAIAIFVKPSAPAAPATVVVTQTVPAGQTAPPTATEAPTATDDTATAPEPTTTGKVATGGGTHTHTTGPATTASSKVDPSIAALLGGPGTGPSVGPSHTGSSNLSALSSEAISNVVRQRTPGVKRTCWERGGGTESNVNVRVHLVIASTGGVRSSSAEGNDPIVTHCIENQTRSWTFPPSSGTTNVDIPFHFLRQ